MEYIYKEKTTFVDYCKNIISADSEKWIDILESDIKIGNIICVHYYPVSQTNLYEHTPECGIVVNISCEKYLDPDERELTELSIKMLTFGGELIFLNKGHFSVRGRGWDMYVQKYVNN